MDELIHWKCTRDADGIAWLALDKADASVNVLSAPVLTELDALLTLLEQDLPTAVIVHSAKKSGFIAGADIKEFTTLQDQNAAAALIQRGQAVLNRLEALRCPTIALIHGFCLGGGMELALACKYRIADEDNAKFGLPEVKLGIHPGFGGTVRLPPLIGAPSAMDLMLSGRTLEARAARKIGLIHYAVPQRQWLRAARAVALHPPAPRPLPFAKRITNHSLVRPLLATKMRQQVAAKTRAEHYPAPYALIDLWSRHMDAPTRMLQEEAASVARLVLTPSARNLIRVFFLQERLKGMGKKELIQPRHVHVIGGGVMGGDIAAWCALQGMRVTIQDQNCVALGRVMARAQALYKKKLKVPRLIQTTLDRLIPDDQGRGVPQADVVIEAIFENIQAKQTLFREIEPQLKPGALLCTNTSSIPLETLSAVLQHPERLVGLHFFNPVAQMQLVEIVSGSQTDPRVAQQAMAFTRHIDRLPLPVKSAPGFLVNRVLMPYLLEAVTLEAEGVPPAVIDRAALDFGMPMGPLELADTVGLDICLHVATLLGEKLGVEVPPRLQELVQAQRLGKKNGQGFYTYQGDKIERPKPKPGYSAAPDITSRMLLRLVNESVACLREGVVAEADLIDAGVIFGTGFAPFRGGPLHYAKESGAQEQRELLEKLARQYGTRFHADSLWAGW